MKLIRDLKEWAQYARQIASECEGNDGGAFRVEGRPLSYPCLVSTSSAYHGSVSIGPDDCSVCHSFVYVDDAKILLGATGLAK